ncbi:MAG: DUF748 domain-containing protein [Arcobacteraceae bacterium]|jgi:hypothetical protein|nr:DUF748 domain-containing protein [Arcobacteraceae bacterium]
MLKKIFYTLGIVFISYVLIGFLGLPYIIKSQAPKYVKENLNIDLSIQKVDFNPFLFKMNIYALELKDKNSVLVSFENLFLDFDLLRTISNKYLHFKTLSISKPFINIQIDKGKNINLLGLIPPSTQQNNTQTTTQTNSEPFKIQLDTFAINGGKVAFADFSLDNTLKIEVDDINYTVRDFSTLQNSVASQNINLRLDNGASLKFKGGLSLSPMRTYGTLEIDNFTINSFWEVFASKAPIDIDKNMKFDLQTGFVLMLEDELSLMINDGFVDIKNFNIKEKESGKLLGLDVLTLKNLNLLFPATPKTDLLQSDFELSINSGKLVSDISAKMEPLNADVNYNLEALPLDILNHIVDKSMFLDIKSAFLNSKGNIKYENDLINASLDVSLDDLHINNKDIPLVKAKNIFVDNISFEQSKNHLNIGSINIKSPYAYIKIDKGGVLNMMNLTKTTDNPSQSDTKPMSINIGPISIEKGEMTFEDLTLPIHFRLDNSNINGSMSEFSTTTTKPSTVKLDGNIGQYGYMRIEGDLLHNNLKNYTNIKLDFDNIALHDLSGYSGKFVGRKIDDGKLTLDLKYYIEKSKLDAKNNLVISQIKLGERIESKDALSLPLDLAIAILEDRNGIIDIKLPIKGDLDNPEFSIAPIVWQAFTNILAKAITAPFSLLGALFGFGEDEINNVPFYFGSAEISPVQKEPLDKIVQILQSRGKLVINVAPVYDDKNDLSALQAIEFKKTVQEALKNVKGEDYEKSYMAYLETSYATFDKRLDELKSKYTKDKVLDERVYKEELENFLINKQVVDTALLENLAKQRVQNLKAYLTEHKIPDEQIVVTQEVQKIKSKDDKFCSIELKLDTVK